MDFASLMSSEISKTVKTSPPPAASPIETTKKYLKRAEIEAQRQEAYLQEQKAIQREREAKLSKKRKAEDEEAIRAEERIEKRRRMAEESRIRREEEEDRKERARRKRLGLPDLPPKGQADGDGTPLAEGEEDISDDELNAKLRSIQEPAILFGETHKMRLRRYKRLSEKLSAPHVTMTTGPIPTTLTLVPEIEMQVAATMPKTAEERTFLFRQLASYFTMVLTEWEVALNQRTATVKESFQGKQAYGAMVQSRENMRPLFKKFEKGELEDGILEPIIEIVKSAQEKRYVDANDGYLRLSIGKAAWPIGVTMVGIHERSAREKLHESDKGAAHIMSDEVTRKFLQSIKRCLSFAQTRWPPDDQLQLMG
ncbi:mRNA splicing protein prp18 [Bachmanniomyces sp. S44760]|nr:mRNA splicing protein prp18 [Bachmanniomyces sp. S44760]